MKQSERSQSERRREKNDRRRTKNFTPRPTSLAGWRCTAPSVNNKSGASLRYRKALNIRLGVNQDRVPLRVLPLFDLTSDRRSRSLIDRDR